MVSERPGIRMRREGDTLVPCSEYDAERLREVSHRSVLSIEVFEYRSQAEHRLYWAVLRKVVESTGHWPRAEAMHEDLKEACGLKGQPTGIEKMSAEIWRAYSASAFELIQRQLLPDLSIEDILNLGRHTLSQEEQDELAQTTKTV